LNCPQSASLSETDLISMFDCLICAVSYLTLTTSCAFSVVCPVRSEANIWVFHLQILQHPVHLPFSLNSMIIHLYVHPSTPFLPITRYTLPGTLHIYFSKQTFYSRLPRGGLGPGEKIFQAPLRGLTG
jgi:hypothetical protein